MNPIYIANFPLILQGGQKTLWLNTYFVQKAPEGEEGKEGDADPGSASSTMSANATKEITNFITQNPDEVTKEWLFKMIIDEIDEKPEGSIVLVDMVPNLKFLLRATAFMQKDEKNEALEAFEAKVRILRFLDPWNLLLL